MPVTFPGETADYRVARNALLEQELALRSLTEQVAELRRTLPDGGPVPEDYLFTDLQDTPVKMSDLITPGRGTLSIYSLMYRPDAAAPCPMCVSMLDAMNAQMQHLNQLTDFVVVAAAKPAQLRQLVRDRGWSALRLYSAQDTSYHSDYHAETAEGAQLPIMNVFRKSDTGLAHFWASELFFAEVPGHARHVDTLWPLWNLLDMTPEGRGADWYPALSY